MAAEQPAPEPQPLRETAETAPLAPLDAKETGFLNTLFAELQSAMRYRSDNEYKLLNLLVALSPLSLTAAIGLYELTEHVVLYVLYVGSLAVLLTLTTWLIHRKIHAEHQVYRALGRQTVRIWRAFRLFDAGVYLPDEAMLEEGARTYGQGPGYRKTLDILWAITLVADFALAAMGALKVFS